MVLKDGVLSVAGKFVPGLGDEKSVRAKWPIRAVHEGSGSLA
jgi:hypothetical protein